MIYYCFKWKILRGDTFKEKPEQMREKKNMFRKNGFHPSTRVTETWRISHKNYGCSRACGGQVAY